MQQAKKEDRITFTSLVAWPGTYVAADGRFMQGETERRAAIVIGPSSAPSPAPTWLRRRARRRRLVSPC